MQTTRLIRRRYHVVQEFNKGVYDYIIATDESGGKGEEDSEEEEDTDDEGEEGDDDNDEAADGDNKMEDCMFWVGTHGSGF